MRSFLFSLGLGFTLLCTNAQEEQTNHVDLASDILDFLSRTELCLNSCRDAESTQAAIPRLKELKTESDKLTAMQQTLPDPTEQDCIAVLKSRKSFITIWKAIRAHIERLETENLMTQELRDILYIAPPSP